MIKEDPIVGKDYTKLVVAMKQCAENNNLPQLMEIRDISNVTLSDIHSLITRFTKDTDLCMKFSAEICRNCNQLHAYLYVDYLEEEESQNYLN